MGTYIVVVEEPVEHDVHVAEVFGVAVEVYQSGFLFNPVEPAAIVSGLSRLYFPELFIAKVHVRDFPAWTWRVV
jgi:hypothetical protein